MARDLSRIACCLFDEIAYRDVLTQYIVFQRLEVGELVIAHQTAKLYAVTLILRPLATGFLCVWKKC